MAPELLVRGAEWSDSLTENRTRAAKDSTQATTTIERTGHYRVMGDTTVAGLEGWIVDVKERIHIADKLKTPQKDINGTVQLDGTDDGFVVVAKTGTGFLVRSEHASLTGWLEIPLEATKSPVRVPIRTYYDATLTRLP